MFDGGGDLALDHVLLPRRSFAWDRPSWLLPELPATADPAVVRSNAESHAASVQPDAAMSVQVYAHRLEGAFSQCRQRFAKGLGWASCQHADRVRHRGDGPCLTDGEVDALKDSVLDNMSSAKVKKWTRRWAGGGISLKSAKVHHANRPRRLPVSVPLHPRCRLLAFLLCFFVAMSEAFQRRLEACHGRC